MVLPTWAFRELVYSPTEAWTRERLCQLPSSELTNLCCLAGIHYSGTKQEQIERLISQTAVQRSVRGYGLKLDQQPTVAQIQAFADAYKGKELKAMSLTKLCGGKPAPQISRCRTVGCYAGSTKYSMAASLIGWRFACLRRGQEYYRRAREVAKASPTRQLTLKLD